MFIAQELTVKLRILRKVDVPFLYLVWNDMGLALSIIDKFMLCLESFLFGERK